MRRTNVLVNAVTVLLVCSGIYGALYSIVLIWSKSDLTEVGNGFQTRTVYTADQITQVVLITQEERLPGAVALINSIVTNTQHPVHFSIITDNSSVDHLWEWIEKSQLKSVSYQITGLTLDWIARNLNVSKDDIRTLSYARLLIGKIFPSLRNKVILLDEDIIVQGDVSDLFHTPIRPAHVGAFSSDCEETALRNHNQGNRYGNLIYVHKAALRPLQLNTSACTFSLGVCVIDVHQWEEQNITQNAIHWLKMNKKIKLYKGDGPLPPLLISLDKRISFLNADWHVRNLGQHIGSHYDEGRLSKAKLLHWNGVHKPWTKDADESAALWNPYFVPDPTNKYSRAPHQGHK